MVRRERAMAVETINASCPGYSSCQGLRRLDDVWPWKPDWLVVYFGWNDHWNSLTGRTDAELASLRVFQPVHEWLQPFHTYWAAARLVDAGEAAARVSTRRTPRVPLDDYRANLEQMAAAARRHECRVVFVTAPTALVDGQLPQWAFPFFQQYYEMTPGEVDAIPAVHRQYNDMVRQVAARSGELVLDLAEAWRPDESAGYFRRDGIHLTEQGHAAAARALFDLHRFVSDATRAR
jgi:lysophospholipase L1-like esterase